MASGSPRTINVTVKENDTSKTIKMLNGGNGSPRNLFPGYPGLKTSFAELGIVDIRTHDWFGIADIDSGMRPENVSQPVYSSTDKSKAQQLFSNIANKRQINLNASKDETPSWNFEATDFYIKEAQSISSKAEILFRLGRSLGDGNKIPDPQTYANWAKAVVKRYATDYQQHGISRPVLYWEIWNEPDLASFYDGSANDFYTFYSTVSKAIKSVNSKIKVGGPGTANPVADNKSFIDNFLSYCKSNKIPLDFYSWHHYCDGSSDPYDYYLIGQKISESIKASAPSGTQSFLTEWNITPTVTTGTTSAVQTMQTASFICSALTYMQDAAIDKSYFYRCDAMHLGIFNKEHNYTYASKAFAAFESMRSTPYRLYTQSVGVPERVPPRQDTLGYTCLAGTDKPLTQKGARKVKILVSNYTIDREYVNSEKYQFSQYSIDTTKTELNISKDYYGGKDPNKLHNTNDKSISSTPAIFPNGSLALQNTDYKDNNGLILNIEIPKELGLKNYKATFSWLADGKPNISTNLDTEGFNTSTPSQTGQINNGTIRISRPEVTEYVILIVTLDLS
ncbi:GH39 family glycosyl hydrolase [Pseudomonas aeruginosa]|uniref:GH39 family glycosyl hydrolase n=1 Tax=Pseudomonas aeruginosa TaxID=287 RepID=UPI003770429E